MGLQQFRYLALIFLGAFLLALLVSQKPGVEAGPIISLNVQGPTTRPLPNFVGQKITEAKTDVYLEVFKVTVRIENDYDSNLAPGIVTKQAPRAGTSMYSGMTVTLWVSAVRILRGELLPIPITLLPDLTGQFVAAARQNKILLDSKAVIETVNDYESTTQSGVVTRQEPAPGTMMRSGMTVKLWVAARHKMPNLVSQPLRLASPLVRRLRLGLKVEDDATSAMPPGTVTRQFPPAGAEIQIGQEVTLWVAVETIVVPKVTELLRRQAEQVLSDAGLKAEITFKVDVRFQPGVVLNQSPEAGMRVVPGSVISLTVASADMVEVPNVIDQTGQAAEQTLRDARLRMTKKEEIRQGGVAGIVLDQTPAAGEQVEVGTIVTLTVSAPEQPAVIAPITPAPVTPVPPPGTTITGPSGSDGTNFRTIVGVIVVLLALAGAGFLARALFSTKPGSKPEEKPHVDPIDVSVTSNVELDVSKINTEGQPLEHLLGWELRVKPAEDAGIQQTETAGRLVGEETIRYV